MNEKEIYTNNKKTWIDFIADNVYKYYNNRQIVLWGKYEVSDEIKENLERRYGVKTSFYVENDITKIDDIYVRSKKCLEGKANQYYVVIPLRFYQSLKDDLIRNGYSNNLDYFYFSDCIIQDTADYYEDSHGNKIIGNHRNLTFHFSGFNSTIKIDQDVYFHDCKISMNNESTLTIGGKTSIESSLFVIGSECNVDIGQECKIFGLNLMCNNSSSFNVGCQGAFSSGKIHMMTNSLLEIGNKFIIEPGYIWRLSPHTKCMIGEDCMFSYDIYLRTNDGHSIFDLNTGENISSAYKILKNRQVIIGNHVWIGMRSTILYNTEIADGSIIGAASLVKGKIPNNCIAAGIPSKVIRTDIAWCYEYMEDNIATCGKDYIQFTNQ